MTELVYPGTFDPPTIGHKYVIDVLGRMGLNVDVLIAKNPDKTLFMFSEHDRMNMLYTITKEYPQFEVYGYYDGLVADFHKGAIICRGLRYTTEYDKELDAALNNRILGCPTIAVFPKDLHVSSSAVRLLIKKRDDRWREYVTPEVADIIDDCIENHSISI